MDHYAERSFCFEENKQREGRAKAENGGLQGGKEKLIAAGIAAVVLICAALVFVRFIDGDTPVDFSEVAGERHA